MLHNKMHIFLRPIVYMYRERARVLQEEGEDQCTEMIEQVGEAAKKVLFLVVSPLRP